MYNKFQTTVPFKKGAATTTRLLERGIATTNLERDMERERERFSRLAQHGIEIQSVEVTDTTVVAIYKSGVVRIVRWEEEA